MAKKKQFNKALTTGVFRVSFPHLFEKYKPEGSKGDAKYSIDMLFPKNTDMKPYLAAIDGLMVEKYGADKKKWPKFDHPCIKDGDKLIEKAIAKQKQPVEAYAGNWVLTARSDSKPAVVDENKQEVLEKEKVYGGCYARAAVSFFTYDNSGNSGISIGLNAVQFVRDGESFGRGRVNVDAAFGDDIPDDGADDPANYSSESSETEENSAGF